MPHIPRKPHRGRTQRIIFGKLELSGKNASLKGRAFGALDQRFPDEHVIFIEGACGYAFGWVVGEGFVLYEESFGSYGCGGSHLFAEMEIMEERWCVGRAGWFIDEGVWFGFVLE